jgi:hypothetical protein
MKSFLALLLVIGTISTAKAQEPNMSEMTTNQIQSENALDQQADSWADQDLMRPPRWGRRLPPGSYQRSCYRCEADRQVLSCICQDSRGRAYRTSIYYRQCRRGIDNYEGRLVCSRRGRW